MSLHLGNEVFDVYKAPLQGDHNHLFIRQGTGLQGQAVFKTKLTFRYVLLRTLLGFGTWSLWWTPQHSPGLVLASGG